MLHNNRKTTPKVRGGEVQRKNRAELTPDLWNTRQPVPTFHREDPGRGFRHLLRTADLFRFIELLPDWNELALGLDVVVLARASGDYDGWYSRGLIGICAWERGLWRYCPPDYYLEHEDLLDRLQVPSRKTGGRYELRFTEGTARAYQLIHVFLHELGHHHDLMSTRSKRRSSRGESYAEQYANRYFEAIWEQYQSGFRLH